MYQKLDPKLDFNWKIYPHFSSISSAILQGKIIHNLSQYGNKDVYQNRLLFSIKKQEKIFKHLF